MPMQQPAERIEREGCGHGKRVDSSESRKVHRDAVELVAEDVSQPHIARGPQSRADRVQTNEHKRRKTSSTCQWRGHGIQTDHEF